MLDNFRTCMWKLHYPTEANESVKKVPIHAIHYLIWQNTKVIFFIRLRLIFSIKVFFTMKTNDENKVNHYLNIIHTGI